VQCLIDLLLLPVGRGDQDFRQVVGGPELQGITPDQAIGGLMTLTWSMTLAARERPRSMSDSSFETAWFLDSAVASIKRLSFGKWIRLTGWTSTRRLVQDQPPDSVPAVYGEDTHSER
jgi:hypothetical protein